MIIKNFLTDRHKFIVAKNVSKKKKAELNRDRRQWERYKTMMPDKTPKTLSAFRKSKKSNSDKWQELESQYRSERIKQSKQ